MKKISLLSILFFLSIAIGISQTVPQGMKYQAVARDLSGDILANQDIILKINLNTNLEKPSSVYSEIHSLTTNKLGLFTLTIGEGKVQSGEFTRVPWNASEIWMEIAIQSDSETEFVTISNSKMLSVPYAFHAATASELVGIAKGSRGPLPGVNSHNWSLFGNHRSNPENDVLGTTDMADIVVVTNNIERMRILADGNIDISCIFVSDSQL